MPFWNPLDKESSQQDADVTPSVRKTETQTRTSSIHILHNNQYHINVTDWIEKAKAKKEETHSINPKIKVNSQYCQLCKVHTLHKRDHSCH